MFHARVGDPEWQQREALRGSLVNPNDVMDQYQEVIHAAEVLGRPDLALALSERVSSQLVQKFAPLLLVLRELMRRPLEQPFPHLDPAPEPQSPRAADVWREAMAGVEDPAEWSHEHFEDMEESETKNIEDGIGGEIGEEIGEDVGEEIGDEEVLTVKLQIAKPQPVTTAESVLSHRQMVRELVLMIHDMSCLDTVPLRGVSADCTVSVWHTFKSIHDDIKYGLPPKQQQNVLKTIREAQCGTVVQLLTCCEQALLANYDADPEVDMTLLNKWLAGELYGPPFRYPLSRKYTSILPDPSMALDDCVDMWLRGDTSLDGIIEQSLGLPPYLHHPKLYEAVTLAVAARQTYNLRIDSRITYTHTYRRDIDTWHHSLMMKVATAGLRDTLRTAWRTLANVYLAQDPRMLDFVYEWRVHRVRLAHHTDSNDPTSVAIKNAAEQLNASALLQSMWPDYPVRLTAQFVPSLQIAMDPYLAHWLGPNFSKLFSPQTLSSQWQRCVRAIVEADQVVELELHELSDRVALQLEREPLKLNGYL